MTDAATTRDRALARYRQLLRMRHFDEACLSGVMTREVHGELHVGIGQEAIGAGIAESLRAEDAVVSTHRNHFHALAKGVDERALLAEIYEKESGLCRGRGGHMHPFDAATRFSATGIVGASLPVALGHAYAFRMEGRGAIALGVVGDGAVNTGGFHEAMNIAGAWKLPLVVLVENNLYAISVRIDEVSATPTLAERAGAYGAWGRKVDGTDPDTVADAFAEAAAHARGGSGPAMLEATAYRFHGHFEGDHDTYRPREERKRIRAEHDPLALYPAKLTGAGLAGEAELQRMADESKARFDALLADIRAEAQPDPAGVMDARFAEEV